MSLKLATNAVHAGHDVTKTQGTRAVPIYQSTSYVFNDSDHAANLFSLAEPGFIYTRLNNPTNDVLEQRLAAVEGGVAAVATASGTSAIATALLVLLKAGDHIVASSSLYGGTYNLFHYTFKKFGIDARFVDGSEPENFKNAIDENTRCIYLESIGNPRCDIPDFDAIAEIAHEAGIPVIVDNTLASPVLFRPFEHGADIVVASCTKFIGGHGTSIGGIVVEKGDFPWGNGKFPELTEPDPSYHGMKFFETFGPMNLAYILKMRVQLLRDLGPAMSPFNAFQLIQGLETLHLRMPKHCENAQAVAEFLESHPKVSWVKYAGLESHPSHAAMKKYMPNGCGAIFGFGITGANAEEQNANGIKLINNLKLFSHLANVGDSKSLVIHPSSTTHQQLSTEEQANAGVTADLLRLSIGTEDQEDIIADLKQALETI